MTIEILDYIRSSSSSRSFCGGLAGIWNTVCFSVITVEQYNVNITPGCRTFQRTKDSCMNETVRMVGCKMYCKQADLRMLQPEGQRGAENARSIKC